MLGLKKRLYRLYNFALHSPYDKDRQGGGNNKRRIQL
jgi:hypothetical protein